MCLKTGMTEGEERRSVMCHVSCAMSVCTSSNVIFAMYVPYVFISSSDAIDCIYYRMSVCCM